MQGGMKKGSDFCVPCSGVETFQYLPCKCHQHGSHHKTPILHVNDMGKLPGTDMPNNHTDKTSQSYLLQLSHQKSPSEVVKLQAHMSGRCNAKRVRGRL
jgi:hypothetical protein